MSADVLYTYAGPPMESAALEAVGALSDAGLRCAPWDGTTAGDVTGLLVLPNAGSAACNRVREASARLHARRLAVLPGRAGDDFDLDAAVGLLRAGADDVLPWAGDAASADALCARVGRWQAVERALGSRVVTDHLIGDSPTWRRALRDVIETATFGQSPLLLTGQTGTGKELLTRLVHTLDRRPGKRDLVTVDCTTLSRELMGSELFGHEKGAFTGAVGQRDGAVASADGGTLFLDEVGELPPDLQGQFLRVLQEQAFKRVGGDAWRASTFRLVCATNRDLPAEVAAGRFRRDLYHRIAGVTCRVPSLAQRPRDVVPLAEHFLAEGVGRGGGGCPPMARAVRAFLTGRAYDGNVRELRQLVLAIARRYPGAGPVTIGCLPPEEREQLLSAVRPCAAGAEAGADWRGEPVRAFVRSALAAGVGLREIGRAADDAAVRFAVEECGSLRDAAARLGVTERALQLRRAASRRAVAADEDGASEDGASEDGDDTTDEISR